MGDEAEYLLNAEIDDYLMTDLESEHEETVSAADLVWKTKRGKRIPINQINYRHLKNIIKVLEKKVPRPNYMISVFKQELHRRNME